MVGKSTDGGATFADNAFRVVDEQPGYGGVDKFYLNVGPAGPGTPAQAVYVAYERNAGGQPIMVAGSNDGGNTFTTPLVLDTTGGGSFFAGPAVGPNGELYVTWQSTGDRKIKARVDPDGLWGPAPFGPLATVRNLSNAMAQFVIPPQPRRGIYNNPSIDVDRSGGPHNGRAYVAFVDRPSGTNTDVFLTYSDDGGATWLPLGATGNVENEPGSDFHSWVAVDQSTGSVNVLYYTTDGDPTNRQVVTRVASSFDGGATFSKADLASQRSEAGSASYSGDFLDYIGLDVVDGTIHALWSDNRGATPGTFRTDLHAYTARAGFQSDTGANNLVINGDAGPTDETIVIRRSPQNADYLEVLVNGQFQYAGLIVSVNAITVNGGGGNDTVLLEDLFDGVTAAVNGGTGSTTLVGPNQANTWNITGTNAGILDGAVTFTDVANLTGGTGADTFVFADGQG
jgi:hypothetical protein